MNSREEMYTAESSRVFRHLPPELANLNPTFRILKDPHFTFFSS